MQSKHADLVVFGSITDHFPASGEEHEVGSKQDDLRFKLASFKQSGD